MAVADGTTAIGTDAVSPLIVAETVALPVVTAVTIPLALTVATLGLDAAQETVGLATVCPAAFLATTTIEACVPTFTVTAAGEMLICVGAPDATDPVLPSELGPVTG